MDYEYQDDEPMCEPMFFKARLWRETTNTLLSVEIYEPLTKEEWHMYIGIKFPGFKPVSYLKPVPYPNS